jgi:hypothetical protein
MGAQTDAGSTDAARRRRFGRFVGRIVRPSDSAGATRSGDVLSNTRYDQVMANGDPANAPWPPETACLHHWDVLARLAEGVGGTNVGARLATLESEIRQAIARYALLQSSGVQFETPTGPRDLTLWLRVVQAFRSEIGA